MLQCTAGNFKCRGTGAAGKSLQERMLQRVRYSLHMGDIAFLKLLVYGKAIFRFVEFFVLGSAGKQRRDEPSLAIDLVLAKLGSSFGGLKACEQRCSLSWQ